MSVRARGTVHEAGGGVYQVRLDDGLLVEASLRGRLKQERRTGDRVVVGDRVDVAGAADSWTVETVLERTSEIVRRGLGGRRAKVLAANVDRVFAVVAARDPDPSPALVDRLLVVLEASGVHPVLAVNKVDRDPEGVTATSLRRIYEPVGYTVLALSAVTGEGLEGLRALVHGGVSAFIGPSGAGKSSLLNALHPALGLRTGDLSRRTGRGRHTTVSARLVELEGGGLVADTPGFGDVGLWGVEPGDVARCFPELVALEPECRFRGCAHLSEPGCAVRLAVEEGRVAESRHRSYAALREEAVAAAAR